MKAPNSLISTLSVLLCSASLIGCSAVASNQSSPTPTRSASSSQLSHIRSASSSAPAAQTSSPQVTSPQTNSAPQVTRVVSTSASSTTQSQTARPQSIASLPVNEVDVVTDLEPDVGTITNIVAGDLMCYISFIDERGIERTVGGTFDVCQQQELINYQVRLIYGVGTISDCPIDGSCGPDQRVNLVVRLDSLENDPEVPISPDSLYLSNGIWTVTIGNLQSWSGVNGTGDLTYDGCDANGNCLSLTGGTVTCRDGVCYYAWQNGDYFYTVEAPIVEEGATVPPHTLLVRQGETVLHEIVGLQ